MEKISCYSNVIFSFLDEDEVNDVNGKIDRNDTKINSYTIEHRTL